MLLEKQLQQLRKGMGNHVLVVLELNNKGQISVIKAVNTKRFAKNSTIDDAEIFEYIG